MKIGNKGDVDRYIIYITILLLLLIVVLAIFFGSANEILKGFSIKEVIK